MKRKLPLTVLEQLEEFVSLNYYRFSIDNKSNALLKVVDNNDNSLFYFAIYSIENDQGKGLLKIQMHPRSESRISSDVFAIKITDLNAFFKEWVNLLDKYNTIKTFFDDPIVDSFSKQFYSEVEFIDEDADIATYSIQQILAIDSYLEETNERLNFYITEDNKDEITDIQNDISDLRNTITTKTKKKVVKALCVIWGEDS